MILDPKRSEPWFNERLTSITGENVWCKQDEIIYNQINRQNAKLNFFYQAFEFISENSIVVDYHEFGCHRCRTFRWYLKVVDISKIRYFFAYDSFKGLPKVETDHKFGQSGMRVLYLLQKKNL